MKLAILTADHLGSPRVTTDGLGAVVARKDYSAFGEETVSAQRQAALGYASTGGDAVRKGYTGYEKDGESGLDFAQARYYNSEHGRYTSVDPLTASASIRNPQTFNRYSYVLNSPYIFTDPLGLKPESGPDFKTRVLDAINGKGTLSKEDYELALFQIRNGTALGYAFLNASYAEISRQSQQFQPVASGERSTSGVHEQVHFQENAYPNNPKNTNSERSATYAPSGNQFPVFSAIVDNYVNSDMGVDHGCAMRLSYALMQSGMDFSDYPGYMIRTNVGGRKIKLAARAYELFNWLYDKAISKDSNVVRILEFEKGPSTTIQENFFSGSQGIILFKDFWGNSQGHIDWLNAAGQTGSAVTSGPNNYFDRSKQIYLIILK